MGGGWKFSRKRRNNTINLLSPNGLLFSAVSSAMFSAMFSALGVWWTAVYGFSGSCLVVGYAGAVFPFPSLILFVLPLPIQLCGVWVWEAVEGVCGCGKLGVGLGVFVEGSCGFRWEPAGGSLWVWFIGGL